MTDEDEICERIAIEVEHLEPDEAQAEYDRRLAEREQKMRTVTKADIPDAIRSALLGGWG